MHGIVASGHPETSSAAAEILSDGGNAFDAALAALMAACVTEPLLASLGGGGFLLAGTPSGPPRLFDFFAQTPARRNPEPCDFYPIQGDFGTRTQEFHIGAGAIAVPGMIHGLFHVHDALGRLPFQRLAEPAIRMARLGVTINTFQAEIARILEPIARAQHGIESIFTEQGELIDHGSLQVQPELADTLESLAVEGPDRFYKGELGRRLVTLCSDLGGHLVDADLSGYRTIERRPLEVAYRNHRIATNPVPCSGGTLIAHSLKLLDGLRSRDWRRVPARYQHVLPHVMSVTNVERIRSGLQVHADPETAAEMLGDDSMAELINVLERHPPAWGGTTHVSVVDGEGNIASTTTSNGEGCGHLLPDAGIHLNNFLGEQDLMPEGIDAWRPDRRLSSMMAPTLVQCSDGARLALGSGGSNRLRTAITQVLIQVLELERTLDSAVHAPRMHLEDDQLSLEPGFDAALVTDLGHEFPRLEVWDQPSLFFGGVHMVKVDPNGRLSGCGDRRRGGAVVAV